MGPVNWKKAIPPHFGIWKQKTALNKYLTPLSSSPTPSSLFATANAPPPWVVSNLQHLSAKSIRIFFNKAVRHLPRRLTNAVFTFFQPLLNLLCNALYTQWLIVFIDRTNISWRNKPNSSDFDFSKIIKKINDHTCLFKKPFKGTWAGLLPLLF